MERDFKGIWITKDIWLSEDLTLQEKVFLVEIDSLDNDEGCFANNQYFADFFGISKTRVSLVINSLVEKGYVTSQIIYKEGTKQILKRVLKVCYRGYLTNVKEPIQQKLKDNNITNNTINNTTNIKKKKSSDIDILINDYTSNEKLIETLQDFLKMRKSIKKPMTSRAMELLLKKLNDLSTTDDEKIAVLNQSIFNSWQGIFPLKAGEQNGRKGQSNNSSNTEDKIEYDFSKYGA